MVPSSQYDLECFCHSRPAHRWLLLRHVSKGVHRRRWFTNLLLQVKDPMFFHGVGLVSLGSSYAQKLTYPQFT